MKIIVNNIDPLKLNDELIKAGCVPLLHQNNLKENEHIAENTWITFADDTDMDLVQQIIDTHDPTPLLPQTTKEEMLEQRINDLELFILMQEGLI